MAKFAAGGFKTVSHEVYQARFAPMPALRAVRPRHVPQMQIITWTPDLLGRTKTEEWTTTTDSTVQGRYQYGYDTQCWF